MSLSRDSKNEKKLKCIWNARLTLRQRLERIDLTYDELYPMLEAYKAGAEIPFLELNAAEAFDIEVIRENQDSPEGQANAAAGNAAANEVPDPKQEPENS